MKLYIEGAEDDEDEEYVGDMETWFEFSLTGNTLTFVKLTSSESTGASDDTYAGEDFFGGKFFEITLNKQ